MPAPDASTASAAPAAGVATPVAALPELFSGTRAGHAVRQHLGATAELEVVAAPGLAPLIAASCASPAEGSGPWLVITATARAADECAESLGALLPQARIESFPSWETLPHERLSPRADTVGRRLSVLRAVAHPEQEPRGPISIICASIRAVLQPVVAGLGQLTPVHLSVGQEIALIQVVEDLVNAAYVRTDLVGSRGEFAVRGGILDIFPPTMDHPVRIEFFGDEVEEIRSFHVADQRTFATLTQVSAPVCREVLLTDAVKARAAELAEQLPGVADMLHKVAQGIAVEGMESLAPVLVDRMEPLLDALGAGTRVIVIDPERVRMRAADLAATSEEFLAASWSNAVAGNAVPVDLQSQLATASHWSLSDAREHAQQRHIPWWSIAPFGLDTDELSVIDDAVEHDAVLVRVPGSAPTSYRGDISAAAIDLGQWCAQGWRVLVTTVGHGLSQRLREVLAELDIPARLSQDEADLPAGVVNLVSAPLATGFVLEDERLVVLTERDLMGNTGARSSTKDMAKMPSRRRRQVDPLSLRPGDYVVHEQHGVGSFVEMMQRSVGGATREYLVIEYAPSKRGHPGDRLFVPTDQLDQVSKYVGGEAPTVHKLGGSDWQQTKARARKHVKQIAAELIRLYSARMATPGHAFGPDTPWQRELEDAFAYVETPDQLSSIDEVKADMEKPLPMDRLICGDVGYGKTEIAVRAAFKAVQEGKQVAVLVPTTLLVQQHHTTFSERYGGFPVTVAALSRFQTPAQAKKVIDGLADGSIDVVIGTHRLLSKEIEFKDLGLVIIDEEQRFGVEHKEQLKAMRTAVDVLAMSATPIPRTLEMAVTGIREMSTLATPPEERHPVLTFVGPYDEKQVVAAIRRELLREGQVFFVHNNVASIERTASRLRELIPEAAIETAHGKMGEHRLEQVVLDFWERRFDVLVCTTIVETGLDISNANTLIIDRADRLGLSQLHQLRGRVGRGRERAYAYILYPPDKPLNETAHERLQTIASNTDLGAGMAVAMKDLEIRGAGNLLGGEQSGHIAGVGFDLYVRMVGEAVADFKGEGAEAIPEVKIELPINAHLPHEYIPGERLRLEAYTKLAQVSDEAAITAVVDELTDRYGPLPTSADNLIEVARLRILARSLGITDIALLGSKVRITPVQLKESQQLRLGRLFPGSILKEGVLLLPRPTTARVGGQPLEDLALLSWANETLTTILAPVVSDG